MKLPSQPIVSEDRRRALSRVIEHHANHPEESLAPLIHAELGVDLSTQFAGQPIAHPIGKASGQLSCTMRQVEEDIFAGLGFIVLKTVIAEAEDATRSMDAWAERETKMTVEPITGSDGSTGWTVTWKGRGWHGTLESYLELCRAAFALGDSSGTPIIPSVKYHLPPGDEPFNTEEYQHTTQQLADAWGPERSVPLTIEKDFSPTLAGDGRASDRENILRWVRDVPELIRKSGPEHVRVGMKLMNAMFDDDFQRQMLTGVISGGGPAEYVVVFNRMFNAQTGVAYGGPDLSGRNLRVLRNMPRIPVPMSGTGDICTGRMMLEYALVGCENGQLHTVFQIPRSSYLPGKGGRSVLALRTLLLHPEHGLVPWLWCCEELGIVQAHHGSINFTDVVGVGLSHAD